ncbi:hypothetical protein FS749_008778 [Ceratobasidium sp. UAMH 11750]|nr:hypothetical protein FS749_008778 [Ceratobasidium sp. UAMH 11750]
MHFQRSTRVHTLAPLGLLGQSSHAEPEKLPTRSRRYILLLPAKPSLYSLPLAFRLALPQLDLVPHTSLVKSASTGTKEFLSVEGSQPHPRIRVCIRRWQLGKQTQGSDEGDKKFSVSNFSYLPPVRVGAVGRSTSKDSDETFPGVPNAAAAGTPCPSGPLGAFTHPRPKYSSVCTQNRACVSRFALFDSPVRILLPIPIVSC